MDGGLQFSEHVVAHFMTARAELLGVGHFHGGIEGTPEQNACNKAANGQKPQAEMHTGPSYHLPVALEQLDHIQPPISRSCHSWQSFAVLSAPGCQRPERCCSQEG